MAQFALRQAGVNQRIGDDVIATGAQPRQVLGIVRGTGQFDYLAENAFEDRFQRGVKSDETSRRQIRHDAEHPLRARLCRRRQRRAGGERERFRQKTPSPCSSFISHRLGASLERANCMQTRAPPPSFSGRLASVMTPR
jgi:hypothetical protein